MKTSCGLKRKVVCIAAAAAFTALLAGAPEADAGKRSKSSCGVSVGFHIGSGAYYGKRSHYRSGVSIRIGGSKYYGRRDCYPRRTHRTHYAPPRYIPRRSYSRVNTYNRYGRVYRDCPPQRIIENNYYYYGDDRARPQPRPAPAPEAQESMYGAAPRTYQDLGSVVVVSREPDGGPDSVEAGLAPGWRLLAEGRPDRAMIIFARAADRSPYEGQPKVGYSIACALMGDHEKAEWAMRRALRIDPEVVQHTPATGAMKRRLMNLAARYERGDSAGDAFMLASVQHALGREDAATAAIEMAAARGDSSEEASNLRGLLAPASETVAPGPILADGLADDDGEEDSLRPRDEVVSRSN